MGVVADPAPSQLDGKGAGRKVFFSSENHIYKYHEKTLPDCTREIYQKGPITFIWTKSKIDDDDMPLPCAPYPQSFLSPVVFQEARSILQEIRKIQETGKIQSLWECLITNILSFSWMFTKRSIFFCVKTCAVPIQADWRSVTCDRNYSSQKWSVRKPRIPQKKQQMKGKTISYLKNICEPHFFQTTC